MTKTLLVIATALALQGCAHHPNLGELPKSDDEYLVDKDALTQKYPEILAYESARNIGSPLPIFNYSYFPYLEDIVNVLGEPTMVENAWGELTFSSGVGYVMEPAAGAIILFARTDLPKVYNFERGDYCIKARVDSFLPFGFKPYMKGWSWQKNIAECRD